MTKFATLAEVMQRPRAWLVAQALERYVDTEAWQVPASQQAAEKLAQGEADLVGHDEITTWLSNWGTAQETAPLALKSSE